MSWPKVPYDKLEGIDKAIIGIMRHAHSKGDKHLNTVVEHVSSHQIYYDALVDAHKQGWDAAIATVMHHHPSIKIPLFTPNHITASIKLTHRD